MPLLIVLLALVAAFVLLIPLSIVQRYRVGTARRRARGWVAGLNAALVTLSAGLFLVGAALTNLWIPDALRYSVMGLVGGALLGALGLLLTRWDAAEGGLHYTPNRWLVLGVTSVVAVRILYSFWRGWQTWRSAADGSSWIVAAGVPGSLAAGGIVLGYYLMYWTGVRRRLRIVRR